MILSQLLSSIITEEVHGSDAIAIESVVSDSRQVGAGSLFVAVPGPVADGHNFINAALEKGAVAVVCERLPQTLAAGVTNLRTQLGRYTVEAGKLDRIHAWYAAAERYRK